MDMSSTNALQGIQSLPKSTPRGAPQQLQSNTPDPSNRAAAGNSSNALNSPSDPSQSQGSVTRPVTGASSSSDANGGGRVGTQIDLRA